MQNQPPTTGAPSTPTPAVGPDPTNPVMPNVDVPGATAPSASITPSASTASSPASTPNLTSTPSGSVVAPAAAQPFGPAAPGSAASPTPLTPLASIPKSSPIPPPRKSYRGLIEMIILVVMSLLAVTFIGLFIWKYIEWDTVKTDIDGQIDAAVAVAVSENTTQLEKDFLEREKYPYKSFMGPADYGSLGLNIRRPGMFILPKTPQTVVILKLISILARFSPSVLAPLTPCVSQSKTKPLTVSCVTTIPTFVMVASTSSPATLVTPWPTSIPASSLTTFMVFSPSLSYAIRLS